MKFTLSMTSYNLTKEQSVKYEKYGFKFREKENKYFPKNCMVSCYIPTIEFNTIEDLVNFSIDIDEEIILNGNDLEIYNDYRE